MTVPALTTAIRHRLDTLVAASATGAEALDGTLPDLPDCTLVQLVAGGSALSWLRAMSNLPEAASQPSRPPAARRVPRFPGVWASARPWRTSREGMVQTTGAVPGGAAPGTCGME
jgi:hypothetical protein